MSGECTGPAFERTQSIAAANALTAEGWQRDVTVNIDVSGRISSIEAGTRGADSHCHILLPAVANLHSHAFQRAMAGMTETQGSDPFDSFWTWRKLMYQFLDHLTPEDVQSIAAFGQMEMLESGYAAVGEFHYLHHQPDGTPYHNRAEMCQRIVNAAAWSGMGLTLLPVLYHQGGCDGRALSGAQRRFANDIDDYARLHEGAALSIKEQLPDGAMGVAPHSLRAVSRQALADAVSLAAGSPVHIHIAEQEAEVEEILSAWNARPVEWLLREHDVNENWCLVHATQMLGSETVQLAATGAVAGLCPITESNLGDGIFNGMCYRDAGGRIGIGTDSNVRISLSEELRTLEYSQRLRDRRRARYADASRSAGRALFASVAAGGARALQRDSGSIAVGQWADLLTLDPAAPNFLATQDDGWLDAWIFSADDRLVRDVWSAGRHVVSGGIHVRRELICAAYASTLRALSRTLQT